MAAVMSELDLVAKKATALKATLELHEGNKSSPGYKAAADNIEKVFQKEARALKRGRSTERAPSAKKQAIQELCLLKSQDANLKWRPLWEVDAGYKEVIAWLRAQFDDGAFLTPPCGRDGCSPKQSLHGGPAPVGRFMVQAADVRARATTCAITCHRYVRHHVCHHMRHHVRHQPRARARFPMPRVQAANAKGMAPCLIFAAEGNPEFPTELTYTDEVAEGQVTAPDEGEEGDDAAKDVIFKFMEPIFALWGKTNDEIDAMTNDEVEGQLLSTGGQKKVPKTQVDQVAEEAGCPVEVKSKGGKLRWLLSAAGVLLDDEDE